MIKKVKFIINLKVNEEEAKAIFHSLIPEFDKGFPGISNAKIKMKDSRITVELEATSISRARAIFNAFMRWLISMENLNDILRGVDIEPTTSS